MIQAAGILTDASAPGPPAPMVATRDIAELAAQALRSSDWHGTEVLGPQDLTGEAVARILGDKLGKPGLHQVQLPYPEMAQALVDAGFAPDAAALTADLTQAIDEGRIHALQPRDAASAKRMPSEQFAEDLARSAAGLRKA